MAPTYIYYRVFDANGIVNVKHRLPAAVTGDKTVGRIPKSHISPPFNVANVKLSIAQREGYQAVFEAAGAQLFTTSSTDAITDKDAGLLQGAGLSLGNCLKLKFPRQLQIPQSDMASPFVGKWECRDTFGNKMYAFKQTWYFTLKRTAAGNVVAVGYEHSTTTYTGFVCPGETNGQSLPPKEHNKFKLSNFKVASKSSISFTRAALSSGVTWKVSGDLHVNGKALSLTMKRAGLDDPFSRVYKRVE